MDDKERRYQVACKLLNITEGKPITRKPRNPARGFKIAYGLEETGWKLEPDELIAFGVYFKKTNEARTAYGDKPLSPPENIQGWHNLLVQWRYSEDYQDYLKSIEPPVTETAIEKTAFSKEKMDTIFNLMAQGFRDPTPEGRAETRRRLMEVLND